MKNPIAISLLFAGGLAAQTVLISPTERNGGFEIADSNTFRDAPFWDSYFSEGDAFNPFLSDAPQNGSFHGSASGFQAPGRRRHPVQTIPASIWTIQEGDQFLVRVAARPGPGFDVGEDQLQTIFHVLNANGNQINDFASPSGFPDRLLSEIQSVTDEDSYQTLSFLTRPVAAGSPWIGNRIQLRFLNTGTRSEFVYLDDVELTGYRSADFNVPLQPLGSFQAEGDISDELNDLQGTADPDLVFGPGFGTGKGLATHNGGATLPLTLPEVYSIAFWMKTDSVGTTGTTLSWRDGSVILDASGDGSDQVGISLVGERLAFGDDRRTLFSRTLLADDRWHHIAVTRSRLPGGMQLFINGQLEDWGQSSTSLPASSQVALGRTHTSGHSFQGTIDDVRIYQGTLDQEVIESLRIGGGDADGDGSSDIEEAAAGTDWGDAQDRLRIREAIREASGFTAKIDGRKSRAYQLQRLPISEDPLSPTVAPTTTDSVARLIGDNEVSLVDANAPADRALYQVTAEKGEAQRPNILLIVGDDHGYADVSAYAHSLPDISTPNLDRIAAAGVRFTQAYVTSAVCSPSRCGFLTGRYQNEWEPEGGWAPGLPGSAKHLAEYLQEADYTTAMIGKSDFGLNLFRPIGREYPPAHGFDQFFGFSAHAHDFYLHSQRITDRTFPAWPGEDSAHLGQFLNSETPTQFETLEDGVWQTTEFTDRAVEFLEEQETATDPFFLYLSHASVHALIHQVPKEFLDEENVPELPLFDPNTNVPGNPASYNQYYFNYSRPTPQVASGIIADGDMRKYYRAHLKAFDIEIGRVLDALESTGQLENTIVIYFSDNGGEALTGASNLPLTGSKYNLFEGGIRVPFMMSWPGVFPENQVYSEITSMLDLTPTLLEAAGIEEAPQLRGFSLVDPVRENRPVLKTPRTLFWRFNSFWAIRRGDWKMVFTGKGIARDATSEIVFNDDALGREALFNLADDPSEMNDLSTSTDPEAQRNWVELKALFDAWDASNRN